MAMSISCKDVGMVGCDFTAKADTMDELMQAAAAHAKEAHGMDSIPPELLPMVQSAVRDEQHGLVGDASAAFKSGDFSTAIAKSSAASQQLASVQASLQAGSEDQGSMDNAPHWGMRGVNSE